MDNDSVEMDINVKVAELFQSTRERSLDATKETLEHCKAMGIPISGYLTDTSIFESDSAFMSYLLCVNESLTAMIAITASEDAIVVMDSAYRTYAATKERLEL